MAIEQFKKGEVLTAAKMNTVRDAVNQAQTDITSLQTNSATKSELSAATTGSFYGYAATAENLPTGGSNGYAYVGTSAPYAIYNCIDGAWTNSGSTLTNPVIEAVQDPSSNLIHLSANGTEVTDNIATPEFIDNRLTEIETELSGLIFDVSEANGGTSYESLSDALSVANDVLLPEQKKGGMSIKYVQSSDNKYVQWRCLSDEFTTDVTQWQGVDSEPISNSDNLVTSGGVALELDAIKDVIPSGQSVRTGRIVVLKNTTEAPSISGSNDYTFTGKNLFDESSRVEGKIKNDSGVEQSDSVSNYFSTMIPVVPGDKLQANFQIQRAYLYTRDKQWIDRPYIMGNSYTVPATYSGQIIGWVQIQTTVSAITDMMMVNYGDSVEPYVAYKSNNGTTLYPDYTVIYSNVNLEELTVTFSHALKDVQEKLISGANIKTINGNSILDSGNVALTTETAFNTLSSDFNVLSGSSNFSDLLNVGKIVLERGTFTNGGKNASSDSRIRIAGALSTTDAGLINVPTGYLIHEVYYYSAWESDDSFTLASKETVGSQIYKFKTKSPLVRFSIRKSTDANLKAEDLLILLPYYRSDVKLLKQTTLGEQLFPIVGRLESDGSINTTYVNNKCTDFIYIPEGTTSINVTVHKSTQTILAFYDRNKTFISPAISGDGVNSDYAITPVANARYVIVSSYDGVAGIKKNVSMSPIQNIVNSLGSWIGLPDSTKAYGYDALSVLNRTDIAAGGSIVDDAVTTHAFIEAKFDADGMVQSVQNYSYVLSNYFRVHGGKKYEVNKAANSSNALFYDQNYDLVGYAYFANQDATIITTPANAYYCRCAFSKSNLASAYFKYVDAYEHTQESQNLLENSIGGEYDLNSVSDRKRCRLEDVNDGIRGLFSYSQYRRAGVKFKLPDDIFSGSEAETEIVRIYSIKETPTDEWWSVRLVKSATDIRSDVSSTNPDYPVPVYKTGIRVYSNNSDPTMIGSLIPDGWKNVDFLGENVMSIRFTGDCSTAANQDIRLSVTSTTLRIYHSTGNTDIASFTLASYATMQALYEAILAETQEGGDLEDFEIQWYSLDNFVPSDIIPCNVALVAEYKQVIQGQLTTAYEAYPYYFTCIEKDKEHSVEVIFDMVSGHKKLQILIDGMAIYQGYKSTTIPFYFHINTNNNAGIEFGKFYYYNDEKDSPDLFRIFYFEGIKEGLEQDGLLASQKRVAGTAEMFKRAGFSYCTFNDMLAVLEGTIKPRSKKLYHISHDDSALMVVLNDSIRRTYLRNGIYPSIACFTKSFDPNSPQCISDADKKKLLAMMPLGFKYHIHGGEVSSVKNISYLPYADLVSDVDGAIESFVTNLGVYPAAWNNHIGPINYNTVAFLRSRGFRIIMAGNGTGLLNNYTRYCVAHNIFTDEVSYNTVKSDLITNRISF